MSASYCEPAYELTTQTSFTSLLNSPHSRKKLNQNLKNIQCRQLYSHEKKQFANYYGSRVKQNDTKAIIFTFPLGGNLARSNGPTMLAEGAHKAVHSKLAFREPVQGINNNLNFARKLHS